MGRSEGKTGKTIPRKISLRREAEEDLDRAISWYEYRQAGLGDRFSQAVNHRLGRISAHPEQFPVIYQDIRHCIVKSFPYAIYFRIRPRSILIIGVIHGRRNPESWKARSN